jgi:MFS family permease
VFGPVIAGFVAETWHWRLVFLGLLPFILVSGSIALGAMRAIPDQPGAAGAEGAEGAEDAEAGDGPASGISRAGARADRRRRYAWAVAVTFGAALLTTGLLSEDPARLLVFGAAGIAITLVAFHRLTPAGTLRVARGYPAAVLLRGFLTFAFFSIDVNVALLLVEVRGWSAAAAGIALTAATVSWTAGAWIQARTVARVGAAGFVRIGFPVVALGIAGVGLTLLPAVPAWIVVPTFALAGLGMGLAYSQFAIIVLRDAPRDEQGAVTSAVSLSDALGNALGTGIAGAIVATALRAGAGPGPGLAAVIGMCVAVALAGFLLAPRLVHRRAATTVEPASDPAHEVAA